MTWGMVAVAGASLVGGAMASSASKKAANTQAESADKATQLQKEMFDKQIELNQPFREGALSAQDRLLYLMGLPPTGSRGAATGASAGSTQQLVQQSDGSYAPTSQGTQQAPAQIDRNALRAELLPQFTKNTPGSPGYEMFNGENTGAGAMIGATEATSSVDEQGLSAAIEQRAAQMQQQQQAAQAAQAQQQATQSAQIDAQSSGSQAGNLTGRGSLMTPFGQAQYDADAAPKIADFSMADFEADPGYAFRQTEQEKALQRAASAGGTLGSGKYLKDAMTYSGNLASQEYGNAFNRFQTNRLNKLSDYGQAYNRFQINRSNVINPLQSLIGVGQTATGQQTQAAGNYAANAGNNIIGAGNAQAAGQAGSANAINGAISQGAGMYQQQNMLNQILNRGSSSFGSSPMSSLLYSNGSLGD